MASGPSFRLLGIPVRIDPTFFVVAALLGFGGDLSFLVLWVAVVTVSVLAHELGHGVAFRAFGKQPEILLQGMGGLTAAPGRLPPGRDLVVSLAGPLTGLLLIGLPALWLQAQLADSSTDWHTALGVVVFVNIAWSIVNLLPVLPLDGGRVAASGLHLLLGQPADRAAHVVSVVVAGGAALWAYAEGQVFAAVFAAFFVAYNLSQLSHLRASDRATAAAEAGGTAELVADPGELDALVDRLRAMGDAGVGALVRLQSELHHAGRFEDSVRVGQQTFPIVLDIGRSAEAATVAYNVACSLARAGQVDEGLMWLERAVERGLADRDLVENDPDLERLRATSAFEALRSRLS